MVYARFTIAGRAAFTLFALAGPMRTGKLSISRGHRVGEAPPAPRLVLVPREAAPPPPKAKAPAAAPPPRSALAPEYQPTHDRLAALERLARLHKQGALTPEEFAFEKARLLAGPAAELVLQPAVAAGPPLPAGPSLAGRIFDWRLLPLGLVLGLGLSYASQPQATIRFFDDALRLLGA